MSVEISNPLLNTDCAAAYVGVRPKTLVAWRCNDRYRLPFVRVGRKIYYRISDLEAWLHSRTENFTAHREGETTR